MKKRARIGRFFTANIVEKLRVSFWFRCFFLCTIKLQFYVWLARYVYKTFFSNFSCELHILVLICICSNNSSYLCGSGEYYILRCIRWNVISAGSQRSIICWAIRYRKHILNVYSFIWIYSIKKKFFLFMTICWECINFLNIIFFIFFYFAVINSTTRSWNIGW